MIDPPFQPQPLVPDVQERRPENILVKVLDYYSESDPIIARCVRVSGEGTVVGTENIWVLMASDVGTDVQIVATRVYPYAGAMAGNYRVIWRQLSGGGLPTPQYQGQFIGAVAQNQVGASFIFAHAME